MPKATLTEESEYKLPEDTMFPAVLHEVNVKTIKYKKDGKDKSFDKWEWTFKIIEGDFAGLHAYGETEDRLTTHPDNKVRQWAETLRGMPFEFGEGLDTDDLLGLPCVVTVRHEEPREKKDGGFFYGCPVQDVFPEGADGGSFGTAGEAPPY